jgi:hypothetical protein
MRNSQTDHCIGVGTGGTFTHAVVGRPPARSTATSERALDYDTDE